MEKNAEKFVNDEIEDIEITNLTEINEYFKIFKALINEERARVKDLKSIIKSEQL